MTGGRWALVITLALVMLAEGFGANVLRVSLEALLTDPRKLALGAGRAGRLADFYSDALPLAPVLAVLLGIRIPPRVILAVGAVLSVGGVWLLGLKDLTWARFGLVGVALAQGLIYPAVYASAGLLGFKIDGPRRHFILVLILFANSLGSFLAPVGQRLLRARGVPAGLDPLQLSLYAGAVVAVLALILAFALRRSADEVPAAPARPAGAIAVLCFGALFGVLTALFFELRPSGVRTVLGPAALPLAQGVLLFVLCPFFLILARKSGESCSIRGLGLSFLIAAMAVGSLFLEGGTSGLMAAEVLLRLSGVLVLVFSLAQLGQSLGGKSALMGASLWLLVFHLAPRVVDHGLLPANQDVLRWIVGVSAALGAIALLFSNPLRGVLCMAAAASGKPKASGGKPATA